MSAFILFFFNFMQSPCHLKFKLTHYLKFYDLSFKKWDMNTNHIVFFTQLYYPDMTTIAIIMTDLVEDLAAYGLDTTVVCAQPTYVKNSDPQITPVRSSGPTGQAQI
jgi:hypothetical protein